MVCLVFALRFHDITTQAPFEVGLAIPNKASPPRLDSLHLSGPLRIVRFSAAGLTEGVEEHLIDRVPVRITGLARTVADCFKYRNKIGLDVALEALKEGLGNGGQTRRATVDDLWHIRPARPGRQRHASISREPDVTGRSMRENIMRRLLDGRAYLSATEAGYACPQAAGQSAVRCRG